MEDENKKSKGVKFYYYSGGTRYYCLVTGTSGYLSAEFRYPGFDGGGTGRLVVPEVRTDSAHPSLPAAFPQSVPQPSE